MVFLPVAEIVLRGLFSRGIPASVPIVQNLTLWVGFLGAALAARENRLLSLATGELLPAGRLRDGARVLANAVGAGISTVLALASLELLLIEREFGQEIGAGIPVWVVEMVMPFAFAAIALRLVRRASDRWPGRLAAAAAVLLGVLLSVTGEGDPAVLGPLGGLARPREETHKSLITRGSPCRTSISAEVGSAQRDRLEFRP